MSRTALLDRLAKWSARAPGATPVFLLSSPSASGKSHCLREFTVKRKEAGKAVIGFEFHGGVLREEQTCELCLLELMTGAVDLLNSVQQPTQSVAFDPTSLEAEDGLSLFRECFLFLLLSLAKNGVDVVFVIDGVERCGNAAKLWSVCQEWAEASDVRLILSSAESDMISLSKRVEVCSKVSLKNADKDELIYELFERQRSTVTELDANRVKKLTAECNGNVLMARLAIVKKLPLLTVQLPSTLPEMFEAWFEPWWGPKLVGREESVSSDLSEMVKLVSGSASARDWFCDSNLSRCRVQGHLERVSQPGVLTSDLCFHLLRAGEHDGARAHVLRLDSLMAMVRASERRALLDLDAFCAAYPEDVSARVVRNAMWYAKAGGVEQLPLQLLGRLPDELSDVGAQTEIQRLRDQCLKFRSELDWFRPARPSFAHASESTLRVLLASGGVSSEARPGVCCTADNSPVPNLMLTCPSGGPARVVNTQTGRCEAVLTPNVGVGGPAFPVCVAMVAMGENSLVALISTLGKASVWMISVSARSVITASSKTPDFDLGGDVRCATLSPFMPNLVLIGAQTHSGAMLWQIPLSREGEASAFPKVVKTFSHRGDIGSCSAVAFVPSYASNELVCTVAECAAVAAEVRLWNMTNEQCVGRLGLPPTACIAFRGDGLVFATGGADGVVRVWRVDKLVGEAKTIMEADTFLPHKHGVQAVCFVGQRVGTSQEGGLVQVFCGAKPVLRFEEASSLCACGEDTLVCMSPSGTVSVVDVRGEYQLRLSREPMVRNPSLCAVLNEHSVVLVSQGDMYVVRLESGRVETQVEVGGKVQNLSLSSTGSKLRADLEDGGKVVWRLPGFERETSRRRRSRASWFGVCIAPASETWTDHLVLPMHVTQGSRFVESDRYRSVTFDSPEVNVWRVPPHVTGNEVVVAVESGPGRVHVLHPVETAEM